MTEYIFNSAKPSPAEITEHDALIRDVLAGAIRMKNNAAAYVRKPDGMNATQWAQYLKGAHFANVCARAPHLNALVGAT